MFICPSVCITMFPSSRKSPVDRLDLALIRSWLIHGLIIRQRNALAPHFMKTPDLIHPYYTVNSWQDPDTRHINARGHQDLANLIASLVQDTTCDLVGPDEDVDEDEDGDEDQARLDKVLERILTEHFKLSPSTPLHPTEEFYNEPMEMADQQKLVDEDTLFWKDQPREVRPWGPWQRAKHPVDEEARTWPGVWPGEWSLEDVPRVSTADDIDDEDRIERMLIVECS
jgi:hypothetical protein